ncbi:MAG: polysaccharide export protein [Rhodobacteraceae bacterium]|nr:polysaccharide export protein [Paracoccaceae bacterium]
MTNKFSRALRLAVLSAGVMVLASCGLPSSGPSVKDIQNSSVENGGDLFIVDVNQSVINASTRQRSSGFSQSFRNAGVVSVDRIFAGDTLTITIWENVENGLFSTLGSKVTTLPAMQVDQLGNIFIPYAGSVKASGYTPDELRLKITSMLEDQTPDPQIEVRREPGDGATVSILGGVGGQGIYPIDASSRRLTGMLARAGGITLDPSVVKITVRRGAKVGEIWFQNLLDNPADDIPLRAGDKIVLEKDERYFISMGTTGQRRISFETQNPTVLEALAAVGGLRANQSNAKGIFVFREEPAPIANRVLGRSDLVGPQKFAYLVDLTSQSSMLVAGKFPIQDEDTIYVTEAPYVKWRTLLFTVIGALNATAALDTALTGTASIFE